MNILEFIQKKVTEYVEEQGHLPETLYLGKVELNLFKNQIEENFPRMAVSPAIEEEGGYIGLYLGLRVQRVYDQNHIGLGMEMERRAKVCYKTKSGEEFVL